MTSINKKRARTLSPGSESGDVDDEEYRRNPKTHENGTIGGNRLILEDNKAGDPEYGLKSNTCLVCDVKDNWVLVCHGEECPLAIHQTCTSDEPDFDEFGNFYCPYCWYKRVLIKSLKLQKKLMMTETSRKGRETLGGVDLASLIGNGTEEAENAAELNVSCGRTTTSVNPSENRRECDESNKKCMVMGMSQQMKEATVETHFREVSITDDADVDEERHQQGRFSVKIHACNSNVGEGRKGGATHSEEHHEKVQVHNSDIGEERMQQRMCDINHETTQVRCFDASVKSRNRRRYSEKNQQNKIVAGTHEQDCFTNDERTQACNSHLGEWTNGQGCYHENNQQNKVFFSGTCEKEVPKNDNRVSNNSELEEVRNRQGSHIVNNQHIKTLETEIHKKEVSRDQERKRKQAVARDGDGEDEDKQYQVNMRKDDEQENSFRKDEQVERMVSSPMSSDNHNESNAASQELALIIHPMAGVQERPIEARPCCSLPFQPEKYGHKSYLEKNGTASNDHGQRMFDLCNEKKRKRLFWTQAEEEMLMVGVQKFPGVRNIPWRKILEFGRDVFHDHRVPSDLKDKWKKMNKMSLDTGKWVSLSTERQPNNSVSEA